MPEIFKKTVIEKGVLNLFSKLYDKIILAVILFISTQVYGQYKQVDINASKVSIVTEQVIQVAQGLAEEKTSRESLQVSFDSLLHCLEKKRYKDSIDRIQLNRTLRKILDKVGK